MDITMIGHASFKLKGKQGTVVTDPFDASVGFSFPSTAADIVTVSHGHVDHNHINGITGTARREKPWIVTTAGEYEVAGISIFGYESFHDDKDGSERGKNVIYKIVLDGLNIVHLGDLGHTLSDALIEQIGNVDVLLCPVGGVFSLDPEKATEVIQDIEPSYVIPMHYKSAKHAAQFAEMKTVEEFEKEYGVSAEPVATLSVTQTGLPEQTTLVVLS